MSIAIGDIEIPSSPVPYIKATGKRIALNRMGNKRRIGREIIEKIRADHPDRDILVVPFAGGLGGSTEAIRSGMTVFANDLDPYVVALIRALTDPAAEGYDEMQRILEKPDWVLREDFLDAAKKAPEDYPQWWVGYLQSVWSFGGVGQTYLYGKKVELPKLALHCLVVEDEDEGAREVFGEEVSSLLIERVRAESDIRNRRLAAGRVMRGHGLPPQIHHLERLQHLAALRDLEELGNLYLSCGDYKNTRDLLENLPLDRVVVYCDPPYADLRSGNYVVNITGIGGFDPAEHWEWAESLPVPVYVSEYKAPDGWVPAFSKDIAVKSTPDGNHRKVKEVLWIPEWQHEAYHRANQWQGKDRLSDPEARGHPAPHDSSIDPRR